MRYKILILLILAFSSFGVFGNEIIGNVTDAKTNEPLPFVNIWFKGTNQGTMSDINGDFKLPLGIKDTLCFSSVGYFQKEIKIEKGTMMPISVSLVENVKELGEVRVKPEVSRAKVLFKQILEHKKSNQENMERVNNYKTFARTTVYVALDSTARTKRIINNLDEVTVKMDGHDLKFSPIYLAELGTSNRNHKDSIVYTKKDGIFPKLNQTIESLILLNVVVDLDFYQEQINILGRGFSSPISNTARLNYDIFLNDSTMVDGKLFYSFSFTPKNKYNPLFTGRFTVDGETFALTHIYAYIQKEANINFVNGFQATVSYKQTEDENIWFYNNQEISFNMSLAMNKDTVSKYDSERINEISAGNWLVNKTTQYSTAKRLNNVRAREWKNQPEFTSTQLDEDAYLRIDKLKENDVVKGIDAIGGMVLTSYINTGKIEIGPVFDIYSTNEIEGHRFTVPLRTGEELFTNFTVGGFVGYGTKNNEFKFGVNAAYQPLPTDKFVLRANYSNDYNLVSQDKFLRFIKKNPNTKGNGNFIAAFTSYERNPYLKEETNFNVIFEYNAREDVTLEISPYFLSSKSTPEVQFVRNGINYQTYENYGILMNLRLAFGQYYDKYYFTRVYYIDQIPVINISWDIGKTHLPTGENNSLGLYSQLHGSISGKINMGQTFMRYMVNGGYLFGDAPYDLLDQPVGSMSLGFAKYRFNLLHHASFAHNLYTNIHIDYNGGGVIFNKIPFIKTLKLREMVSLKSHYGKLNNSYKGVFDLPDYYSSEQQKPYTEIGVGVTNIFKVLRVEYVRQLGNSYINSGFADKGGIRFRAEMSF
ncbi:DUF5686 and carboxypeptidase-like regulatory domain-containing protein [Roseimarinus sediminis]|uniref:DUF5686 and carboxypeptidase-like regulatory domain-containing protein n=1 Tax=Roseimarinus sediminis TaxID=1610899 RepID=UPI003D1A5AB5